MKRPAMNDEHDNPPLPIRPAPDPVDPDLVPLLSEPFARVWDTPLPDAAATDALRGRLLGRLAAAREAEAVMFTARRRRLQRTLPGNGIGAQTLYLAQPGRALRPGEPSRARLIEFAPGARIESGALGDATELRARHREWLLLSGSASFDGERLSQRDYHVTPAGCPTPAWWSDVGALLFLRESTLDAAAGASPFTVRDADAGWPDYAPGIRRRVLWQQDGQAALLYHADAGAQVPAHSHGHDEECLMVQGELFLDDLLLQAGDYQLAPAGSGHRITATDTGVVIYAHGDLELKFIA